MIPVAFADIAATCHIVLFGWYLAKAHRTGNGWTAAALNFAAYFAWAAVSHQAKPC